jgi:hypothetical protein
MLYINTVLLSLDFYLGGLAYLMNPALGAFLMLINMLLATTLSGGDDEPTYDDLQYLILQFFNMKFGVGGNMPIALMFAIDKSDGVIEGIEDFMKSIMTKSGKVITNVYDLFSTPKDTYSKMLDTANLIFTNYFGLRFTGETPGIYYQPTEGQKFLFGILDGAGNFIIPFYSGIKEGLTDKTKKEVSKEISKSLYQLDNMDNMAKRKLDEFRGKNFLYTPYKAPLKRRKN